MKSLCIRCPGACCRYIALPFDEPEDEEAFEEVRWFLMHEGVSVFVTDDQWYVSVATPCKHLTDQSLCDVYATRPQICRQYGQDDCDYCGGDYEYQQFFTHPEQIVEYAEQKLARKAGGKKRRGHRKKLAAHAPDKTATE